MHTEDLPLETVPLHAALCPAPQPCPSRAPLAALVPGFEGRNQARGHGWAKPGEGRNLAG
eukprot:scaffold48647_cov27-Phaeocystis_antarctica.AAC.1